MPSLFSDDLVGRNISDFALRVSSDSRLIESYCAECTINDTTYVNPIQSPEGLPIQHLAYDPTTFTVYFSDYRAVWKAAANDTGYRTRATGLNIS